MHLHAGASRYQIYFVLFDRNPLSHLNLLSNCWGRGYFRCRYSTKTSPEILTWDKQTRQQRGEVAWHSSGAATLRVLSANITVNTRPPWAHLIRLLWAGESLNQASERAGTQASIHSFGPREGRSTISALQHDWERPFVKSFPPQVSYRKWCSSFEEES